MLALGSALHAKGQVPGDALTMAGAGGLADFEAARGGLDAYEHLNQITGGDSVRLCGAHPCIGWVEDRYQGGTLKHRGYYDAGQLTVYRNYHPNGQLEREFKSSDAVKSTLKKFWPDGTMHQETRYWNGVPLEFTEFHTNGRVRYEEVKHRENPYYLKMNLFTEDGRPVSTMSLVDKRTVTFDLAEYHANGQPSAKGKARYNPGRMDTQRIGTWSYWDEQGMLVREEDYVDGKVKAVR
ncbi:MAG: hypothetical protein JNM31_12795 [Flavobacteriales bacterium]|nr:hypothetical protein [Flavobacteriales bacterium]